MLGRSIIQGQLDNGPLKGGLSTLRPKGNRYKRALGFTLMLTSLIDAFSILVIYLLVNFSNPTAELRVSADLQIPAAEQSQQLGGGSVVSVSRGHYFIEDKEVPADQIAQKLMDLHTKLTKNPRETSPGSLVIQADHKIDYATLSPVILAANQAGFHDFKFAVLQGGTKQ